MNLDEYQRAWKSDAARTRITVDVDSLTQEVHRSHQSFQSMIFWRDVREAGTSIIMIPIWIVMGITMSLHWTWYLTIPALIWVAGFVLIDRRLHPQRPSQPGEPLLYYVKETLAQVEHQIWLLRNVFWWYLLPFCISLMAFFLQNAWDTTSTTQGFVAFSAFLGLFLFAIYGGTYLVNQRAVRLHLEPRRQDLRRLVDSLEEESHETDAGDLMELVSAITTPVKNCGLSPGWERWAENWNRIVPSWRVAAAIILPTLGGAFCGLYSGMKLQIYEMGPTLFQTVVGAVIPFEMTLFWFMWRSRETSSGTTAMSSKPSESNPIGPSMSSSEETPRRMPNAPATVILGLLFFVSIMAVVALFSCFSHLHAGSTTRDENRLTAPNFADISSFDELAIAQLDGWLQTQVKQANYPSLNVSILHNGKVAYDRSFGFEDTKSGIQATRKTQYHVASVTKFFTASLAVLLHEQGVIDLDAPVISYLPKDVLVTTTPEVGATITLRQLASHTSGLPRRVPGRVQSVEGWYQLEPERLYKHLAKARLDAAPGTTEEYSNLGFGLLGHALELAAKKPLSQLLQELICDPLELERTAFQVDDKLHPATGYDDSRWRFETSHSFRQRLAGSGGLVTSSEDLSKFLAAQMKPGAFSPETLAELHTRTRLSSGTKINTTLGWSSKFNPYIGRYLKKNGGRSNCSAWIGFEPQEKVGVIVITNCGGPDVDTLGKWLLERSISGAYKPVTKYGYAKVAPYSGVRWKQDRPTVLVQGRWARLISIDDIPIERIMQFANEEFDSKAHKRFAEDLVELLAKMGHEPDWEVTLGLANQDGQTESLRVPMTEHNRNLVRD